MKVIIVWAIIATAAISTLVATLQGEPKRFVPLPTRPMPSVLVP